MTVEPGDLGVPLNFPALLGAYLAVNAISDAFILVDGPDCALYKAHFIHGRHDLSSTLLRISGRHRVAFTNVCARGVVRQHDDILARHIRTLDGLPESGGVLVTALPMCSITGVDYGRAIRGLGGALRKPAVDIPPGSLVGDWLDGFAQALLALARGLDLGSAPRRAGTAAIVGYLMDRNEADHVANLTEIRRMLAAVSLEVVSVWVGGEPMAALGRAAEAEWVISLPWGRKAARALAERTGARLVEADLPFGLPRSEAFLQDVARAVGREAEARAFVEAEMARVVPRVQWVLPHLFLGRSVAFVGDPHLMPGFFDIAEEAGMDVKGAVATGRRSHGGARDGVRVLHEPSGNSRAVEELLHGTDLVVTCWRVELEGWRKHLPAVMEFGFPSYTHHAFFERPFLGFGGYLGFIERMADALAAGGRRETDEREARG